MTSERPWFVIAGGGTGGHLYPGLAVAEALIAQQPDFEVTVFGTTRPIDVQLTKPRHFELVQQEVQPFPRRIGEVFKFYKTWRRSVKAARQRFIERMPVAVLGLGGYAAGPPIVAAAKLGIPTALFNPDAVPGLANRRLASKVNRIFVQWESTAVGFNRSPKVHCTGCPIRADFAPGKRGEALQALKLDPSKKTVLITGASQGAHSINLAAIELVPLWQVSGEDWQVVHLTGEKDLELCREAYKAGGVNVRTLAYTEKMAVCMAAADIIVSRAGASTLAEITAMGIPAVLMPYPFDRKQHQMHNARVLKDAHAAEIVEDRNDAKENAKGLLEVLRGLMKAPERRRRMSQGAGALGRFDAADAIAQQLYELARRG